MKNTGQPKLVRDIFNELPNTQPNLHFLFYTMLTPSTVRLLRIPFSFFLSPLYFFSLAQVPHIHAGRAALIFLILHFLIYPASNGYNSYMDRDTGSIGGIEKPPPPSRQLYWTTIVLDIIALSLCGLISPLFVGIALLYIGASKAYSYRGIRLKQYPVIGYLTVIIFQGGLTFWMVYYGSSQSLDLYAPWEGAGICTLLIGGFYPLTQIYQHQQDLDDGVKTLSYKLGYTGTFIFCAIVYLAALSLMSAYYAKLHQLNKLLMIGIFFVPIVVYFIRWFISVRKDVGDANFKNTMTMNWLAASCTNAAFITLLIWNLFE